MVHLPPIVHLVAVTAAGALAGAAAIVLSVIAVRLNDGRAVLLGFAFSVMAVLLVFHALATPGVLLGDNGLVQAAGALNIPIGGSDPRRVGAAGAAPPAQRAPASCACSSSRSSRWPCSARCALVLPDLVPVVPEYARRLAHLLFLARRADAGAARRTAPRAPSCSRAARPTCSSRSASCSWRAPSTGC